MALLEVKDLQTHFFTREGVVWLLRRQRAQVTDPHAVDRGELRLPGADACWAQREEGFHPGL